MATYLQGLTDEILPPLLYKPDYNIQRYELLTGHSLYESAKKNIEDLWASYFNSEVTNPNVYLKREELKKKIDESLTKFAGLNLADVKVSQGITNLISEVGSHKDIINDISFTSNVKEFISAIDLLKYSPGTKENNYLTYNPEQLDFIDKQVREFASLKDSNEIASYSFVKPIYKNYDRIVKDYIKDYNIRIKTVDTMKGFYYDEKGKKIPIEGKNILGEKVDDVFIVETKNGVFTIQEFHNMMDEYLTNNHGYDDYIKWSSEAKIHREIDNVYKNKGIDYTTLDEASKIKLKINALNKLYETEEEEFNQNIESYKGIRDQLLSKKERISYQLTEYNEKINNKEYAFGDIIELENLRQENAELEERLKNINEALDRIQDIKENADKIKETAVTEDITKLNKEVYNNLLDSYSKIYKFNKINNMARIHAMTTMEQTMKESEFQKARLGIRLPGSGSQVLNYTPEKTTFDYSLATSKSDELLTDPKPDKPAVVEFKEQVIQKVYDGDEQKYKNAKLISPPVVAYGDNLLNLTKTLDISLQRLDNNISGSNYFEVVSNKSYTGNVFSNLSFNKSNNDNEPNTLNITTTNEDMVAKIAYSRSTGIKDKIQTREESLIIYPLPEDKDKIPKEQIEVTTYVIDDNTQNIDINGFRRKLQITNKSGKDITIKHDDKEYGKIPIGETRVISIVPRTVQNKLQDVIIVSKP